MEDKIYFSPGEVVAVKHDITNIPNMVVKTIDKVTVRKGMGLGEGPKSSLFGITCYWFTADMKYVENRFNTKDLVHV